MPFLKNIINRLSNLSTKIATTSKRLFLDPLIRSQHPPWYDARGVFVGLFIGASFPLGTQTICMGVVRLFVKFNLLIAFAFSCVNNPVSVGPLYYLFYLTGSFFLERPAVKNFHEFYLLISPILQARHYEDALRQFLDLSGDILLRWAMGSVTISIPLALIGYFVSLRIQTCRARKRVSQNLPASPQCSKPHIKDK
ncbi:MAG: DUF2062 domain-containing protein [Desulfomonilaceae bacterium]